MVVLSERRPDDAIWAALQALGPTLFCKGEPSDGASLAAARAVHARALVYLAHPQRPMKARCLPPARSGRDCQHCLRFWRPTAR